MNSKPAKPKFTPVAAAPTADGRPSERFLLVGDDGLERVLDVVAGKLYPGSPIGTSRLHGYWRPLLPGEPGLDLDEAVAAADVLADRGLPSAGAPKARVLVESDIGGVVWSRSGHPEALDRGRPSAMQLVKLLREARDGFPLSFFFYARKCEAQLPFARTLRELDLVDEFDDVWIMPIGNDVAPLGIDGISIRRDDSQGQEVFLNGILDVVVLTGDESSDLLPPDAFLGRASSVVIEAIGPHSADLVARYRETDALVFLSYPWPIGSSAARTLWQASRRPLDLSSLAECLNHIAMHSTEPAEFGHVARTLSAALHDDPQGRDTLYELFVSLGPGGAARAQLRQMLDAA